MTAHDEATKREGAVERAKRYEGMAARYIKKAMAGAAQLAQTFASLTAAARMERLDWRMRGLGDQLGGSVHENGQHFGVGSGGS
ncbi:hypothetical protein ACFV19_34515 [Streptomyces griseoluteus]|uniref:hypothetical protein n=1 Tax=Streptomyces griseoluteus TaxID=29306 RepID=UPI00368A552B